MTFIAVSIAVNSSAEIPRALGRATDAGAAGASLVEWRIDGLAEEPDALVATGELVRRSPLPSIITCRPASEGGDYEGDEALRLSLLQALAAADDRPRYVDVELGAYERSRNARQKVHLAVKHPAQPRDLDTSLILSVHDSRARPADLIRRVEAMTHEPACAVIKVAWQARSLRDNLEAFELLAGRAKPMIALCMGRFGLMSRVLAPKFGGFLTYATDFPAAVTAPGQPTVDELVRLYGFGRINARTNLYGVIGWPVEHSLGPVLHNAAFQGLAHDGVYLPLPVPPEYEHFKATVGAMVDAAGLDFRGASVTLPHKQHLLRFVAERGGRIDPLAQRIGAANTLVVGSAGGLECSNSDGIAAVLALCEGMGIEPSQLATKRIAIIGAGGAARAVAAGLMDAGATVVVFNRSPQRAAKLVEDLSATGDARPSQSWTTSAGGASSHTGKIALGRPESIVCGCFHAFINCTPVGMAGGPAPDESPLPADVPMDDSVTVFDTLYSPLRTPLIQEAESRGARVITGIDMFIRQAAAQIERWTGAPAPIEAMKRAIARASA